MILTLAIAASAFVSSLVPMCVPEHDGTSHRVGIQACLDARRVVKLPCGTFEIHGNGNQASLIIDKDNQSLLGSGDCTVIKLQRPESGFSEHRMLSNSGSNFYIDHLVMDGGQVGTCVEAKYDEYSDGGYVPGSQGQQQHAIILGGTEEKPNTGFRLGHNVSFRNVTGDAVYLYAWTSDVIIENMTISGYCRSGLTMNTYTGAYLGDILVNNVRFEPAATAQDSARGIDIEPNATITNVQLINVTAPSVEAGNVANLYIEGLSVEKIGDIEPRGLTASGYGVTIRDSHIRQFNAGRALSTSATDLLVDNTIIESTVNADDAEIFHFWGRFDRIGPVEFNNTTVTGTGTGWGFMVEGTTGTLTLTDTTIVSEHGITVFGTSDVTFTDVDIDADSNGINLRDVTSFNATRVTGSSTTALTVNNAAPISWCESTLTGTKPVVSCAP